MWIAQKMKHIAVDRTENETYAVDRAENEKYRCGIAQKMKNIAVDRAEKEQCCCGLRRITQELNMLQKYCCESHRHEICCCGSHRT